MRLRTAFTVSLAPDHDPRWRNATEDVRRAYFRALLPYVLKAMDEQLAAGLDRFGKPLAPIAASTRKHRKSEMGPADPSAPPLMPARGVSRTRLNMTGAVFATHVQVQWEDGWGKILAIHAAGSRKRHLPVRDVFGLAPKSERKVKRWADAWWESYAKGITPKRNVPTRQPFTPLPVLGSSNYRRFTFGIATGSDKDSEVARAQALFRAGRSTGFYQKLVGRR